MNSWALDLVEEIFSRAYKGVRKLTHGIIYQQEETESWSLSDTEWFGAANSSKFLKCSDSKSIFWNPQWFQSIFWDETFAIFQRSMPTTPQKPSVSGVCMASVISLFSDSCVVDFHGFLMKSLHSFPIHFYLPKPHCPCPFSWGSSWLCRHELLLKLELSSDSLDMPGLCSRVCSIKEEIHDESGLYFLGLYICPLCGLSIAEDNSQAWPLLRTHLLA